ncbi:Glucoamylase (glucan-1,4-alpha-glucosidase), GH15 family [Chitinophaga terrae (ex Kim and Jung 2007)]|uniref:Glucoamylase (Glucan-1,4-alpha-glucosidase), GH15 family n=1 Tax=Chitinophaga terrae (ex Kim and Jung 2007) TaxID=408074 RepID=A0A1H4B7E4_9BACT|nr:glycoside hydrolase family 15 protein [Chitinophaga terrae (ex Kim and Jung 2007)]MDQ0106320.1 GH15 family glucan-1,4-alpha-glucosidase [Chitinophaga terrae (ex Kim and Jung 2007)]SEA44113.1 Glucoamylase (glucan-1,4-alpha-glucosidase), GH15 family [Chitinophaga terrae (ex Kim and Jung 2007)]
MERHTYQTGIIGNCAFIAHINKNTNLDWLCWPRMDSTFIFGGLLDKEKGGEFSILPEGGYTSYQYYMENTNVLCTEITTSEGSYRITDYAPRFYQYERFFKPLMMIRKVEPLEGSPRIRVKCRPVCDYGAFQLKAMRGSSHIEFAGCDENIRLTTNIPVSYLFDQEYFVLNDTRYLVLTYGRPLEAALVSTAEHFLRETIIYWRSWIKQSSIANYFQPYVIRSALTLKIHQYEDTGAIIAASTTSLPEFPNSGRNWDYRYCWMRDTYYVITALNHIGHFEEMERYFGYITDISFSGEMRYQPLYGITGQKTLTENILPELDGYLGNKPVRIGNQAYEHIQNDIYGQVLISMLPLYTDHRFIFSERKDSARWIELLLNKIERTIDEKDAGIWEFRNMANIHCYTNLFQWAGCSAAEKMAKTIGNENLLKRASALKAKAAAHIESCYDPERKVYTNAAGGKDLDASTLQLIMMNYLDPSSQRARDHLAALEKELKTPEGLFYRYRHADDFGKPHTTFLVCAFWYVEALACVGRLEDAQREFAQLLQYSNHLLLFSEDVESANGSQWGNFPQAYSHVGLMNAAYRIAMKMDMPIFL